MSFRERKWQIPLNKISNIKIFKPKFACTVYWLTQACGKRNYILRFERYNTLWFGSGLSPKGDFVSYISGTHKIGDFVPGGLCRRGSCHWDLWSVEFFLRFFLCQWVFLPNKKILVGTNSLKILRVGMYINQLSIVNHISSIYFITNTCYLCCTAL